METHSSVDVMLRFLGNRFKRGERYGLGVTIAFVAILALLWVFLLIVDAALGARGVYRLDLAVQEIIQPIVSPGLTRWVIIITNLGGTQGTAIFVVSLAVLLIWRRRWWYAFGLVFASGIGGLVLAGLKLFFQRARPVESVIAVGGYSFPSGHSFAAAVFFGFAAHLAWREIRISWLKWLLVIICFLMGMAIALSRVYLNVHYLTDVVAGVVAGLVWLIISLMIVYYAEGVKV